MKIRVFVFAFISALTPLIASAHEELTGAVAPATAPVGTVGPAASELASFVLSTVALVVAGLALARTRKQP